MVHKSNVGCGMVAGVSGVDGCCCCVWFLILMLLPLATVGNKPQALGCWE